MKNYYELLNLTNQANITSIKKEYKKLVLKLHPDKTGGNPEKEKQFKQITEAYSVLSDPIKKQQYDDSQFGINSFFDFPVDNGMFNEHNKYEEFKETLNININLIISLRDVYAGKIELKYKKHEICSSCDWTGFNRNEDSYECDICDGTGKIDNKNCKYCQGLGNIYSGVCPDCDGVKTILSEYSFNLDIHNIQSNISKKIEGHGHQSKYFRKKKGLLSVNIKYKKVKGYEIIDKKLYYNLDIHYNDAILGNNCDYIHLDNKPYQISIPKNTKDNDIIIMSGCGLLVNDKRENLYIKINIIIDYDRM